MKFINLLVEKLKNIDNKIFKIMNKGFLFSFILSIIAICLLFTYETIYSLPKLFYIGISLFKTALMFAVMFMICGIGFDTIKKQIT